jgi:hypothetical protein
VRRRRDNGEKGKRVRERRISKKTISWDLKKGQERREERERASTEQAKKAT